MTDQFDLPRPEHEPEPGPGLAVVGDGALVCAVDLGGTFTKMALVDRSGVIRAETRIATRLTARSLGVEGGDDGRGTADWLGGAITDFTDEQLSTILRGSNLAGFGVAVPGIVDDGVVRAAANLGWFDLPLATILTGRLQLPGGVDHDVRSAGRAEWTQGAGRGSSNLMFVPLGTGIAAALVVDGRLLRADGYAGEVGHIPVPSAGDARCACGGTGCLEIVASAAGVSRTFARLTGRSLLIPAEQIAGLARSGAPAAVRSFALAGTALAEALLTCLTLLGPETIIIGGGLSGAADLIFPRVEELLAERITFQRRPTLVTARFGSRAGLIGAALIAGDQLAGDQLAGEAR